MNIKVVVSINSCNMSHIPLTHRSRSCVSHGDRRGEEGDTTMTQGGETMGGGQHYHRALLGSWRKVLCLTDPQSEDSSTPWAAGATEDSFLGSDKLSYHIHVVTILPLFRYI